MAEHATKQTRPPPILHHYMHGLKLVRTEPLAKTIHMLVATPATGIMRTHFSNTVSRAL